MSNPRTSGTPASLGATPVSLGTTEEIARRLVELGEQGMASGIAEGFDIDEFIDEMRVAV